MDQSRSMPVTATTNTDYNQNLNEAMLKDHNGADAEQGAWAEAHLFNSSVQSLSWQGVTVTVKDRKTKSPLNIVDNVEGVVYAGELCALMGPSGCGKTTLLNYLAQRRINAASAVGEVLVNGARVSPSTFREITCFVEQEDALIGSLTVRETLGFASRLSTSSRSLPRRERIARIDALLASFGLTAQADTLIGTPLRKGISGGQKRRVGVASQLITAPRILFLDEPTSGLDAAASYEVMAHLRDVARRHRLIVVASIHQPSGSTFQLFDRLLLMSSGVNLYVGGVAGISGYYADEVGVEVPLHTNVAEWLLDMVNTDFAADRDSAVQRVQYLHQVWDQSAQRQEVSHEIALCNGAGYMVGSEQWPLDSGRQKPNITSVTFTLLHRSFIKSYRDVVAYGIRIAMYFGLALMMGTVWLRLSTDQSSIQPIINGLFFGSAFMSFMAVAGVPSVVEDLLNFQKEHHNGLYGATEWIVSNALVGVPYLFLISVIFSVISYFLSNFRPDASAFFVYLMWLFLDLLAAESLVVFFTSLFPSFVVALALVAFANGLWMSVGGFLVSPEILNVFYYYVFHFWDYQKWVFEGMMINEFSARTYGCQRLAGGGCHCMYESDLSDQCLIRGQAVLDQYGYAPGHTGRNVVIMLCIVLGYRIAAWLVLIWRK